MKYIRAQHYSYWKVGSSTSPGYCNKNDYPKQQIPNWKSVFDAAKSKDVSIEIWLWSNSLENKFNQATAEARRAYRYKLRNLVHYYLLDSRGNEKYCFQMEG
jgi:hypothetical protein